jgi:glutamine synthetase
VLQAVDVYGDLLRLSAADCGNDLRLGGQEAPIAVVSVYLGQDLQQLLEGVAGPKGKTMDAGLSAVPAFCQDRADRNRTAAMSFNGNKFEFRMVGASDSVAMTNTVLCTAVAEAFRQAADTLQGAEDMEEAARAYAKRLWQDHKRVVFNGDCYSEEWAREAEQRGLPKLKDMVDAIRVLQSHKTAALFAEHGVLSRRELQSRAEVLYESYAKHLRIEARVMVHMAGKDYIPGVIRFLNQLDQTQPTQGRLYATVSNLLEKADFYRQALEEQTMAAEGQPSARAVAEMFRDRVVPQMQALRQAVDGLELLVDRHFWPVPGYEDLMFGY